jgi:hypothetical protein
MTGVPSKTASRDARDITLMKSGGTGGLQMLFYLGHPSYYSDEIGWSRRFTDAVLLRTASTNLLDHLISSE